MLHAEYDFVVEITDPLLYEAIKGISETWKSKNYGIKSGQTCVGFVKDVAAAIPGIVLPEETSLNRWPEDFFLSLKNLNKNIDIKGNASLGTLPGSAGATFACDRFHMPYTYHKLWGADYFNDGKQRLKKQTRP